MGNLGDPIPNASDPTAGQGLVLGLNGRLPASVLADIAPWLIDINVYATAISQTNFNTLNHDTGGLFAGYKSSSSAQNDEINWDVVLAAGTWTVELIFVKTTDAGIFSVQFDGVEKGTIDSYAAATSYDNRSTVTGITVGGTAKVRLKLKMATKNAASSAYKGYLVHVQLRRTA